jgi:hypothetical protein
VAVNALFCQAAVAINCLSFEVLGQF